MPIKKVVKKAPVAIKKIEKKKLETPHKLIITLGAFLGLFAILLVAALIIINGLVADRMAQEQLRNFSDIQRDMQ